MWYRKENRVEVLRKAANYIHTAFQHHATFFPEHLIIITWDEVGYFSKHVDKVVFIAKFTLAIFNTCLFSLVEYISMCFSY